MGSTGHAAPVPAAVPEQAAAPAAVIGAIVLSVVIGAFVWLAVREDAVRSEQAAIAQARRDAAPVNEADRIRAMLLKGQAAAERAWRNSTPLEQRRAQEDAMLARSRAEDDAMLTVQRLRQIGNVDTPASAVVPR